MRHSAATAPETIPEGAPVYENWSRGPQQYVRSGRGSSGTFGDRNVPMRKSQSYAGIQPVMYFIYALFTFHVSYIFIFKLEECRNLKFTFSF